MKELLGKLEQVDPATYKRYQGGMIYTSGEPIPCFDQELQVSYPPPKGSGLASWLYRGFRGY